MRGEISTSPMPSMSFQSKCSQQVASLLSEQGIAYQKSVIRGEKESYVLFGIQLTLEESLQEIYVYRDEVGCFVGKEWFIWEAPDYSTSEELCEAFMRFLREQIRKETARDWEGSR